MTSPQLLAKVARITRRFPRDRSPIMYYVCRAALQLLYPRRRRERGCHMVVDYDRGRIQVDTSSVIEYQILFHGYFEPAVVRLLQSLLRPGDVCIDVGANIGAHALAASFAVGSTGRVIAVEPHPELAARLRANAALNGLQNMLVMEAAVAESDGEVPLHVFPVGAFNRGTSSLTARPECGRCIAVRALCGQSLKRMLALETCRLVLIDVEGAELSVLRQFLWLIDGFSPIVVFEYSAANWRRSGAEIGEALAIFRTRGYQLHCIHGDVVVPVPSRMPPYCEIVCTPPFSDHSLPSAGLEQ